VTEIVQKGSLSAHKEFAAFGEVFGKRLHAGQCQFPGSAFHFDADGLSAMAHHKIHFAVATGPITNFVSCALRAVDQ
jgi:hypothetical protein